MKRTLNTSHSAIFEYWKDKMITSDGEVLKDDFNTPDSIPVVKDWAEPCCWACGCFVESVYKVKDYQEIAHKNPRVLYDRADVKSELNRCHIIPHQAGGSDEASNLFLLCEKCHDESPDTQNPKNFYKWIYKKRNSGLYCNGFNVNGIISNFFEECKERKKNPYTANLDLMKVFQHGGHIAESSIYMALADTCDNL